MFFTSLNITGKKLRNLIAFRDGRKSLSPEYHPFFLAVLLCYACGPFNLPLTESIANSLQGPGFSFTSMHRAMLHWCCLGIKHQLPCTQGHGIREQALYANCCSVFFVWTSIPVSLKSRLP